MGTDRVLKNTGTYLRLDVARKGLHLSSCFSVSLHSDFTAQAFQSLVPMSKISPGRCRGMTWTENHNASSSETMAIRPSGTLSLVIRGQIH